MSGVSHGEEEDETEKDCTCRTSETSHEGQPGVTRCDVFTLMEKSIHKLKHNKHTRALISDEIIMMDSMCTR